MKKSAFPSGTLSSRFPVEPRLKGGEELEDPGSSPRRPPATTASPSIVPR